MREKLENLLRTHLEKRAIYIFRNRDIEVLQEILKYNNSIYEQSDDEAIQEFCLKAPVLSDIPKSITNKFNSVTENAAIHYKEDISFTNEVDVMEIKNKISYFESIVYPIKNDVETVEILLNALGTEERFIIEQFYLYGQKWDYISNDYHTIFGQTRHERHLQRIRNQALNKMERILSGKTA